MGFSNDGLIEAMRTRSCVFQIGIYGRTIGLKWMVLLIFSQFLNRLKLCKCVMM